MSQHVVDPPVVAYALAALADAADGIADLGVTMCFTDETRTAGRAEFFAAQAMKVRTAADDVADLAGAPNHALTMFVRGYADLMRFRTLDESALRAAVQSFRDGWIAIHRVVEETARRSGTWHDEWAADVRERHPVIRERLNGLLDALRQAAG